MPHLPGGPASPARRHFLGLAAAASGRIAALGALGGAILPSSAQARGNGNGYGWGMGAPHGWGKGAPHCFVRGTRIRTPRGETCIEALRVDDLVTTISGEPVPVKWIGRNRSWQSDVLPIRIARSAFDDATPHHDLYLSPRHCVFLEDHLIPVSDLVNGTSVTVAEPAGTEIEYFHIALKAHDVIFAEGAPAETLLMQNGDEHEKFGNFAEYERLYPHDRSRMLPFAPRVGCHGSGREHLKALLQLARAPGAPDPLRIAYDRLARRAQDALASQAAV